VNIKNYIEEKIYLFLGTYPCLVALEGISVHFWFMGWWKFTQYYV